MIALLIIAWIISPIIAGVLAHKKNLSSPLWVIGTFLLSPLVLLILFAMPDRHSEKSERKCPACAEWVKKGLVICKHCGKDLPPLTSESDMMGTPSLKEETDRISPVIIIVMIISSVLYGYVIVTGPSNKENNGPKTNPNKPSQDFRLEPSQNGLVVKEDSIGCISQQAFDEMTRYAVQNDQAAADQMMTGGECELIKKGTPVFPEGLGSFGVEIVRPIGDRRKFYVGMNDVERVK